MSITGWVVWVAEDVIILRIKCLPDTILRYILGSVVEKASKYVPSNEESEKLRVWAMKLAFCIGRPR
jgi:hypothetical protein